MNFKIFVYIILLLIPCTVHSGNMQYGNYKVGNSYIIQGVEYKPQEVESLVENGTATYYGKNIDGKKTANGAVFNSSLPMIAHRTLPMPSVVAITNLQNKKKILAIVVDRGPFANPQKHIIDVSQYIAEKLDFINQGSANVNIEYIPELSQKLKNGEDLDLDDYQIEETIDDTKPKIGTLAQEIDINQKFLEGQNIGKTVFTKAYQKAIYVQIGVFQILSNAQNIYQKLAMKVPLIQLRNDTYNSKNYYIVRSGPFITFELAQNNLKKIEEICKECKPMIVVINE